MKTITSLKHALALFTALALVAANSVFADETPNLDDPKVRAEILKEAVLRDTLEERGPETAKLLYAPNSKAPYTGWTKALYGNAKVKTLGRARDGKPEGPFTAWHPNGQKAAKFTFKDGKQEGLATEWHDNGQKGLECTFKDGRLEGLATKWDKAGKMTKQTDYSKGRAYRERYIPKAPKPPSEEGKKKRNIPKHPKPSSK